MTNSIKRPTLYATAEITPKQAYSSNGKDSPSKTAAYSNHAHTAFVCSLNYKSKRGLTLIDLLITMSISAILIGFAVPSMQKFVKNTTANNTMNQILHQLNYARQNAVDKRIYTVFCPSEDQHNCSSDWGNDWIIFEDENNNQVREPEEALLRKTKGIDQKQGELHWISFRSRPFIRFDYSGTTGYQNGRIYYCDPSEEIKRQLIVYRSGRIRKSQQHELRDRCS